MTLLFKSFFVFFSICQSAATLLWLLLQPVADACLFSREPATENGVGICIFDQELQEVSHVSSTVSWASSAWWRWHGTKEECWGNTCKSSWGKNIQSISWITILAEKPWERLTYSRRGMRIRRLLSVRLCLENRRDCGHEFWQRKFTRRQEISACAVLMVKEFLSSLLKPTGHITM